MVLKMEIKDLFRETLRKFVDFEPQTQEQGWVKLNTTENPYPPIPESYC